MVESTHNTLPYPPQMRNGGSSPAHLPSSSLSDPSWWLQFKWLQPPPRAPKWLFDYYRSYNPPANVCRPPSYKELLQRAIREDQEAAGLLPPEQPYWGPLLHEAHACTDRAYRDWKAAIDDLWADEYAAHARQEAACAAQRFLHERANIRLLHEDWKAARHQRLLDKETARRRCAAQARQTTAARVIFLWFRYRRLFARLTRQTS
jgi:hypothetical protein